MGKTGAHLFVTDSTCAILFCQIFGISWFQGLKELGMLNKLGLARMKVCLRTLLRQYHASLRERRVHLPTASVGEEEGGLY